MRIAEYKQVDTEIIETIVPILDEDGNETGETETVRKEIPVMRTVYRDATAEEEAEQLKMARSMPPMEASIEQKVDALMSYMGVKGTWNGGMFEVVKNDLPEGDYANPIPFTEGMNIEAGKFYSFPDENIWEALKSGSASYTSEWFDIIE